MEQDKFDWSGNMVIAMFLILILLGFVLYFMKN